MTEPHLRIASLSLVAVLSACASAPQVPDVSRVAPPPSVSVRAASEPPAAAPQAPSRREVIRGVLTHNVRVVVYDGDKPRRTASGVVVSVVTDGEKPTTYVITNAHVVDTRAISRPRFAVIVDRRSEATEHPARFVAAGKVPEMDLGLIAVDGLSLPAARLADADELELGEQVIVAAAPYGRPISLSGGMISHLDWNRATGEPFVLKTDAAIGYGASGGGIYSLVTGKLVAIVEGYRTAKISFEVAKENFSFDVPMPGETFAAPTPKVRAFLNDKGYGHLLEAPLSHIAARSDL